MSGLVQATIAAIVFLALHITIMVVYARALGVSVRQITYGVGPQIFSFGKVRINMFPLSGSVKLKDSREELLEPEDVVDAFNHQTVWKQVLLPLSGSLTTLAAALFILGAPAWSSFVSAFPQILQGAFGPLSTAQTSLSNFSDFATENSFVLVFALVATKLSALNLLPFGGFNGGQALLNLIKWGRPIVKWEEIVMRWLMLPAFLITLGWLVALGFYVLPKTT